MTLRERLDNLDEAFKGLAEAIEAELNPKELFITTDGVKTYTGDPFFIVCKVDGGFYLNRDFEPFKANSCTPNPPYEGEYYFSTKEAAKSWCDKQNKPVAIDVKLFNRSDRAVVVKTGVAISIGGTLVTLAHSDIEDIQHAINQLNCYKTNDQ